MMTVARVLWFCSLLLCQALRWAGAAAPGDEDEACRVPNYSASIAVLMDSWRYQSLLSVTSPVWETSDRGPGSSDLWYGVGGTCEQGGVEVCLSGGGAMRSPTSWVFTQYIRKPVSVDYPIRVYIQISYTLTQCNNCKSFEVLKYVTNTQDSRDRTDEMNYEDNGIEPDSRVPSDETMSYNATAMLYFNLGSTEQGFYLSIESDERMCVTISRLLVYIDTCPYTESGLARYPSTPIPLTIGGAMAIGSCAVNAHHTTLSVPDSLRCSILGFWYNNLIHCECNQGYYQDGNHCKAYLTPAQNSYVVGEGQRDVQVCFELAPGLPLSLDLQVFSIDNTAIGNFDYLPVSTSIQRSHFTTTSSAAVVGCIDISVVDDDLKEREESFTVQVTNGSVVLGRVTVTIESSDGENGCSEGSVTVVRDSNNSSLQLVEMCHSEGVWSPLCDTNWTPQDTTVVCREASQGISVHTNQLLGASNQSFSAYDCTGSETHLSQCSQSPESHTICYHLLVHCGHTVSSSTSIHSSTSIRSPTPTLTLPTTTTTSDTVLSLTESLLPSTELNTSGSSSENSQTSRIIAGVVVSLLVIIALVVGAVVLGILFFYWRRKKNITYNTQQQKSDDRKVENPVYYGSRNIGNIVFRAPPPVPPNDPIYENASQPKTPLPFSAIFDDPVYAGGAALTPRSSRASNNRRNKVSVASNQPPLYEEITGHTHDSTHQLGVNEIPEIPELQQEEESNGSVVEHKETEDRSSNTVDMEEENGL